MVIVISPIWPSPGGKVKGSPKSASSLEHECLYKISQNPSNSCRDISLCQSGGPTHRPTLPSLEPWLRIHPHTIYSTLQLFHWCISLQLASCYNLSARREIGNCTTIGNFHMTLLQLYNHPASPLLSLPPCKSSHIRRRPLSCLFSILPRISLYSNGARTLDERWSLARLLLSRWGSPAIDRWLPSGWEEGVRESGRG